MVSIDGSLLIQIVNFIFLIWALNRIVYKPIRNVLAQRKEKIKGLEQSIETFEIDAMEMDDTFNEGIKAARAKGLDQKATMLHKASEKERSMIEKINEKNQASLEENREKIAKEVKRVRETLQKKIDTFAAAISKKILGRMA